MRLLHLPAHRPRCCSSALAEHGSAGTRNFVSEAFGNRATPANALLSALYSNRSTVRSLNTPLLGMEHACSTCRIQGALTSTDLLAASSLCAASPQCCLRRCWLSRNECCSSLICCRCDALFNPIASCKGTWIVSGSALYVLQLPCQLQIMLQQSMKASLDAWQTSKRTSK